MTTLTREDGTVFTYANYRTNIAVNKASIMKNEMRYLARQHGELACVVPISSTEVEGVFSKEKGYPLGELIWDYMKRPQSMLYVEALTKQDASKAIIVVVRDNRVFVDAVIDKEFMTDEFASLVAENVPMDIYVCGDVPLVETDSDDEEAFVFPSELVKSFTNCDTSVFEEIKPKPIFELINPMDALQRSGSIPKDFSTLYMIGVLIIGVIGYFGYQIISKEEVIEVRQSVQVDPYRSYAEELAKPDVASQLALFNSTVQQVYSLAGWSPVKVIYSPPAIIVNIHPGVVTDLSTLALWSRVNNVPYEIAEDATLLTFSSALPNRAKPKSIHHLSEVMSEIYENVSSNLMMASIKTLPAVSKDNYQSIDMTLELTNAPPAILNMLGKILYGKAITLEKIDFNIGDDGSYTGTMVFTVLGK